MREQTFSDGIKSLQLEMKNRIGYLEDLIEVEDRYGNYVASNSLKSRKSELDTWLANLETIIKQYGV